MNNLKIPLYEIFSSYQGEGLFVGEKQLFIRFFSCNLSCSYCDEPASKNKKDFIPFNTAIKKVKEELKKSNIKTISFTGGEPLLYYDIIEKIIKKLGRKYRYLIETNGTLYKNLERIIDIVDIISMDIKLPKYCSKKLWIEHENFLKIANKKNVYIKVVVDEKVKVEDFKKSIKIVESVNKNIPFFIQPITTKNNINFNSKFFDNLYNVASIKLNNVRILPQMHKLLGIK